MEPRDPGVGVLKALAGQVPWIGSVLTGLFDARQAQLYEERLTSFLEDLRAEASGVLREAYDESYLASQDFLHLCILAVEHARKTRQQTKRHLYARALVNAGNRAWARQCDLAEELINTLAELSPIEVSILQAAWEYSQANPASGDQLQPLSGAVTANDIQVRLVGLDLSAAEVQAYLSKLQRLGLTQLIIGLATGAEPQNFRMTPLFDRLMHLITLPPLWATRNQVGG